MVYVFDDLSSYTDALFSKHLETVVPDWRKQKAKSYKQIADRKNSVLAFILLSYGLCLEYGMKTVPEFQYNRYGKPFFNGNTIHFSISHCKKAVICAIADNNVGVDVETVVPFDFKIAQRVCNEQELASLSETDTPHVLFSRYWTRKEAVSKFEGLGMAMSFTSINEDTYLLSSWYNSKANYSISLCYGKKPDSIDMPAIVRVCLNDIN